VTQEKKEQNRIIFLIKIGAPALRGAESPASVFMTVMNCQCCDFSDYMLPVYVEFT